MKRYITLILLLTGIMVSAQENESMDFKTIFGNDLKSGGYGAPELKLGPVHGVTSLLLGGRGGWVIGHQFVIGGAGFGLTTNNTFLENPADKPANVGPDSTRTINIDMGYGGLLLEYILFPKKALHLSFPLIIGGGGTTLGAKNYVDYSNVDYQQWATYEYVESSSFFVLEPGVSVEMNMAKFFRLDAGVTYRFVSGTQLKRISDNDLSNFTFSLTLKFGAF